MSSVRERLTRTLAEDGKPRGSPYARMRDWTQVPASFRCATADRFKGGGRGGARTKGARVKQTKSLIAVLVLYSQVAPTKFRFRTKNTPKPKPWFQGLGLHPKAGNGPGGATGT